MDFQHCRSHGLRVRLSGQQQFLPFTCAWSGWALGALLHWAPGTGDWQSLWQDALGGGLDSWNLMPTLPVLSGSWHGPGQGFTWAAREPELTARLEETVVSVVWKPRENSQKSQVLIFPATEEHPDQQEKRCTLNSYLGMHGLGLLPCQAQPNYR